MSDRAGRAAEDQAAASPTSSEVGSATSDVAALSPEGGTARLQPQTLLTLQRTVGNRAVGRILGSAPAPTIQRAVALTDDDYAALAEQLHRAMSGLGTDEEAIYVALQKLQKDPAAIAKLTTAYKDKYNASLEAEIRDEMSAEELRLALDLIGIKSEPAAGEMVGAAPSTDDEYKAAAKKLGAAMKGLGTDEEAIFAVLVPFNRDAAKLTKLKDVYKAELSRELADDLRDEMSGSELAYALYLLHAPPSGTPVADIGVTSAGTKAHTGTVPGGEVSVHTGGEISHGGTPLTDVFSVGYEGALASETAVVQFLWCEVEETQADGSTALVAESGLPTSNGDMELTTDLAAPSYKVDSGTSASPFYEARGVDIRTSTGTTIYDRPGEFTDVIQRRFDAGATKVVERDHFDQFLVRDYKTIYHTSLVVEWVYTARTTATRLTKFKTGAKVDWMPPPFRKQLIKEYPPFDYIQ